MTHIILTVGMNPLPVLVSAHRLWLHYREQDGEDPRITAIYSEQSHEQAEAVKNGLQAKLGAPSWDSRKVLSADPDVVFEATRTVIEGDDDSHHFHCHYTGGWKSMGVHVAEALAYYCESRHFEFSMSYLDAERHSLTTRSWHLATPPDERVDWTMSIEELAQLHGFTSDFWVLQGARRLQLRPAEPDAGLVSIARRLFPILRSHGSDYSEKWLQGTWKEAWKGRGRLWPFPPDRASWPVDPIPWFSLSDPQWEAATALIRQRFGGNAVWQPSGGSWQLNVQGFTEDQLRDFAGFVENQWLELAAYDCLKAALSQIGRDNHRVGCSVFFTHDSPGCQVHASRTFQLDVLAVLGYQLVVVSCTVDRSPQRVKLKAFEAYHRAKQVGGDYARAVVLCSTDQRGAAEAQENLKDEIGTPYQPLLIWGENKWPSLERLTENFKAYLERDLEWRAML